ncbi:hypothetical protein OOT00_08095 [Desulfobotulus sp. H1]|uniref:Uncharacterized protein n=1 Tax=Desulfobotulus pelophilus TaxID=2823377 RepID=A0ABT3N923_9BACT|nr:hypothetical protein [Desulfobotulus pelophilus]MCW7753944.1 hypothetical protein [Desulfobotulus pelophilus]
MPKINNLKKGRFYKTGIELSAIYGILTVIFGFLWVAVSYLTGGKGKGCPWL